MHSIGTLGLLDFLNNIRRSWCKETASPNDAPEWSPSNPAKGQCAVTACLIQDILGGELMRTEVEKYGSHYYNRLPNGQIVDATIDQFPPCTIVPAGEPRDRTYVLDSPGATKARTRERYELLKARYDNERNKQR